MTDLAKSFHQLHHAVAPLAEIAKSITRLIRTPLSISTGHSEPLSAGGMDYGRLQALFSQ